MFKLNVAALLGLAVAATPAMAADQGDYDGVYVGHTRSMGGGNCPDVERTFSLVIEDGQARMVTNAREGTMVTGVVNARGTVQMKGQQGLSLITVTGTIGESGAAALTSEARGALGGGCVYSYDLVKEKKKKGS